MTGHARRLTMMAHGHTSESASSELPEGAALRTIALTKRFELSRLWRPGADDDIDDEGDVAEDELAETGLRPDRLALVGLDLTVARGSMVGVVGPEAAGKTTLVKLIAGTLRPTSGEVVVRGRVSPPPESLAKLLETAHSPVRNLRLLAAMLSYPEKHARAAAPDIFAAAGLLDVMNRPLQSLPADTASILVMAALLHFDVGVFLFDPTPKIRSAQTRDRLLELLSKRLDNGASALTTARVASRLPGRCDQVLAIDEGRIRQYGPADTVLKAPPVVTPPPTKFRGRSDVVALGDVSVSTDPSGGTSISVPVEIFDSAATLTFGVMLAHEGRATAKYTKVHDTGATGPLVVTVHVPGQRQLAGAHRVHFSVIVARGDETQLVLAQPVQAALRRGLHAAEAEAAWSLDA